MGYKEVLVVVCSENMTALTDLFLLISIHLLSSFCLLKLQRKRRWNGLLLNSIFIFGVYDYFIGCECFSDPGEIAVLAGRIILANCESLVSSIGGWGSRMRVCGQSLCPADSAMSRRHPMLLGQRPYHTRVWQLDVKRKRSRPSQLRWLRILRKRFFGARKPLFSGIHGLLFLWEASRDIVFF